MICFILLSIEVLRVPANWRNYAYRHKYFSAIGLVPVLAALGPDLFVCELNFPLILALNSTAYYCACEDSRINWFDQRAVIVTGYVL